MIRLSTSDIRITSIDELRTYQGYKSKVDKYLLDNVFLQIYKDSVARAERDCREWLDAYNEPNKDMRLYTADMIYLFLDGLINERARLFK